VGGRVALVVQRIGFGPNTVQHMQQRQRCIAVELSFAPVSHAQPFTRQRSGAIDWNRAECLRSDRPPVGHSRMARC
jgi:hypothetical protein